MPSPRSRAPSGRNAVFFDVAFFIALLATAVALGGALAHLFELPNKIDLPSDDYFVVQMAYNGWNQLAYVLLVQFVTMLAVAIMARREPQVLVPVTVAIAALVAAQVVFWVYTFPANAATQNWTTIPEDWQSLRSQWEYSHAVGAGFQLVAMGGLVIAVLARARAAEHGP